MRTSAYSWVQCCCCHLNDNFRFQLKHAQAAKRELSSNMRFKHCGSLSLALSLSPTKHHRNSCSLKLLIFVCICSTKAGLWRNIYRDWERESDGEILKNRITYDKSTSTKGELLLLPLCLLWWDTDPVCSRFVINESTHNHLLLSRLDASCCTMLHTPLSSDAFILFGLYKSPKTTCQHNDGSRIWTTVRTV